MIANETIRVPLDGSPLAERALAYAQTLARFHGRHPLAIHAVSRDDAANLVVMAIHGRTGLGKLLLGSVADDVLRHGTVPLLLNKPLAIQ